MSEWIPVPGFEGLYEASDAGYIRSVDRSILRSDGRVYPLKGRVLKETVMPSGHLRIDLRKDGKTIPSLVHQVVALAFLGPYPENKEICHKDGNPANNQPSNLYYGTRSDNMYDAVNQKTHWQTRKTHCKYGHPYTGANLIMFGPDNRRRACRTCRRTTSWVKRHPEDKPRYQEISDAYLEKIMEEQ